MKRVEVHGHRGSRGTHPENCLASFEESVASGADFFELDVHLSADGEVIVYHDAELTSKLCAGVDRPVPIRSLPASEIEKVDCGSRVQPKFPDQIAVPGQRIPRLDTVLGWLAKRQTSSSVNIEIKIETPDDPAQFAEKVIELVLRYGMQASCQIQSFDPRPLEVVVRKLPATRVSYLFERAVDFGRLASELGISLVGPDYRLLDALSVKRLHDQGIRVIPWTVNAPKDWRQLIDWGVDGIITDYPRRLVTALREP